ncbi:MAG: hypothetical protein ACYC6Y_20420 [Thermoguttaceae bacterium]
MTGPNRCLLTLLVAQVLAGITAPTAVPAAGPSVAPKAESAVRPNLLVIMSDDHACSAVSAYGSRLVATPHIDRLATEGMRLDCCFSTRRTRASFWVSTASTTSG